MECENMGKDRWAIYSALSLSMLPLQEISANPDIKQINMSGVECNNTKAILTLKIFAFQMLDSSSFLNLPIIPLFFVYQEWQRQKKENITSDGINILSLFNYIYC